MIKKLALVAACALAALGTAGTALADAPASTSPPVIPMASYVHVGYTLTALKGTWPGTGLSFKYQWKQCNGDGASCVDIAKATGLTYKPVVGDANETLEFAVTATNSAKQSTTATSAASSVVGNSAPSNTVAPAISAPYLHVGYAISASSGIWDAPKPTVAYQWQRLQNDAWVDIAKATAAAYTPATADAGLRLRVGVKATNLVKQPSEFTYSTGTGVVGNDSPANTNAPSVTAPYLHVGYAISASAGAWDAPKATVAYQWQHCWADGSNCVDITKATAATYTPVSADAFTKIRVGVKATNVIKQVSAFTYSATTLATIGSFGPQSTDAPTVSAPYLHVGYAISATAGSWDAPNPAVAYQWQRCDNEGVGCVDIAKATAAGYKAVTADAGQTVRVGVKATNLIKQTSPFHYSEVSGIISGAAPHNTAAPAITAPFLHVGYAVTGSSGSWDAPNATFKYQWQRCANSEEISCTNIAGATSATYKPVTADAHLLLRVGVSAVNAAGVASDSVYSYRTAPVSNDLPAISGESFEDFPQLSGFAHVGYTLSVSAGHWDTPGLKFSYAWWRCIHDKCARVATTPTYKLQTADTGGYVFVDTIATNAANQTGDAGSNSDGPVSNVGPQLDGGITADGDAYLGQTVHAGVDGDWDTPNSTFTYQWQRCDVEGAACVNIAGATAASYKLTSLDVGKTVRVAVKATNLLKQVSTTYSDISDIVGSAGTAPAFTIGAQIQLSSPHVGVDLYAFVDAEGDPGITGSPEPRLTFQWYSCPTDSTDASDCTPIEGATDSVYTPVVADIGQAIRVEITATNFAGHAVSMSDATDAVADRVPAPVNTAAPVLSGQFYVGGTINSDGGQWDSELWSQQYRWQVCTDPNDTSSCEDIDGVDWNTLTVGDDYAGKYVRVGVIAWSVTDHSDEVFSAISEVIGEAPAASNLNAPQIWGSGALGEQLTVSDGVWNVANATYQYSWYVCDTGDVVDPTTCYHDTDTTSTFAPQDVGLWVYAGVVATNPLNPTPSAEVFSAPVLVTSAP